MRLPLLPPPSRARRLVGVSRTSALVSVVVVGFLLLVPAAALGSADVSTTLTVDTTRVPLAGPEKAVITVSAKNGGSEATSISGEVTTGAPQLKFDSFVGISQGVGSVGPTGPVSTNFGSVAPGATATVTFRIDDVEVGRGIVTAKMTSSVGDTNLANNTASATVDVFSLVPVAAGLNLGSQAVGDIGPVKSLTLENKAGIPVKVSDVKVSGDFLAAGEGCFGGTVPAGGSCQLLMRFVPAAVGPRTGTATVFIGASSLEVPLSGVGVAAPAPDAAVDGLALKGVPKSITLEKFKKGFSVKIGAAEPVALDVDLLGGARKGALASAFNLELFSKAFPRSATARSIKVKPSPALLGSPRKKFKVRLRTVATDAAGNITTMSRAIVVKPSQR